MKSKTSEGKEMSNSSWGFNFDVAKPRTVAVLGSQWGDEGKGKLVDILATNSDLCARFNGGHNAGHTLVINGVSYGMHLLPCGCVTPGVCNIIGNGVVIHFASLLKEVESLRHVNPGILSNLKISNRAHLLFDVHQIIDRVLENERKKKGADIGTTLRGIGPCYSTKAARIGIRAGDILNFDSFVIKYKNLMSYLCPLYNISDIDFEEELERHRQYADKFGPSITDTFSLIYKSLNEGKSILLEGANASFLDIDFGTYPYVTSSSTTIGATCTGLGLNPKKIGLVVGVVKSYLTRVGEGPFPTELSGPIGHFLREKGFEYGVTTGRPRRCGWLDIPMVRLATHLNGFDCINITKLDILEGLDEVKICVNYKNKSTSVVYDKLFYPSTMDEFDGIEPVYETLKGWSYTINPNVDLKKATISDLSPGAQEYVLRFQELAGVSVRWIGVGPDRHQTIVVW